MAPALTSFVVQRGAGGLAPGSDVLSYETKTSTGVVVDVVVMRVKEVLREVLTSIQDLGDDALYARLRQIETHLFSISQELNCRRALAVRAFDYTRFAVLYVDDEQKSLKCFARQYGKTFRVMTAESAADALKLLKQSGDEIGIVMTDLRMPGANGRWLLDKIRHSHPWLVRILVSTFPSSPDLAAAIEAANAGDIYTFVTMPWDPGAIEHLLRRALEYFTLGRAVEKVAEGLTSGPLLDDSFRSA